MTGGFCLSLSICMLPPNSRTERPRKPKIVRKVAHPSGIMRTSFKVRVTRLTNAETKSMLYLTNEKAYEVQTWYTNGARIKDPYHQQVP